MRFAGNLTAERVQRAAYVRLSDRTEVIDVLNRTRQ